MISLNPEDSNNNLENRRISLLRNLCDETMNQSRASAWMLVKAQEAGLDTSDLNSGGVPSDQMIKIITQRAEEALRKLEGKD